jgi:hypothetical protein
VIRPKSGDALDEEEQKLRRLRGAVDRLCEEIKRGLSEADVQKREAEIRALCAELFPDKLELFDQLYGRRFRRIQEQFGPMESTRQPEED